MLIFLEHIENQKKKILEFLGHLILDSNHLLNPETLKPKQTPNLPKQIKDNHSPHKWLNYQCPRRIQLVGIFWLLPIHSFIDERGNNCPRWRRRTCRNKSRFVPFIELDWQKLINWVPIICANELFGLNRGKKKK